jgi:hypothetical protein
MAEDTGDVKEPLNKPLPDSFEAELKSETN